MENENKQEDSDSGNINFHADQYGVIWREEKQDGRRLLVRRDGLTVEADGEGEFTTYTKPHSHEQLELDSTMRGISDRIKMASELDEEVPCTTTAKEEFNGGPVINLKDIEGMGFKGRLKSLELAGDDITQSVSLDFKVTKIDLYTKLAEKPDLDTHISRLNIYRQGGKFAIYISGIINEVQGDTFSHLPQRLIKLFRKLPERVQKMIKNHLGFDDNWEQIS